MNADGSAQRQLTRVGDQYPGGWSPDGRRIVAGDGAGGLVILDPDGTVAVAVSIGAGGAYPVAWLPSGQILLVAAHSEDGPRWGLIEPDGSGLARLPQLDGVSEADYHP